jgi:hypothetical protein
VQYNEAEYDVMTAIHLPMSERVMDKLADILFATDEIIDLLKSRKPPATSECSLPKTPSKGSTTASTS